MVTDQIFFKQAGTGTPLVLIHGLMVNGDMFALVFDTFAKRYHVLVPDLRGHGRSSHHPPPYTVEQHARDLAGLLKSLSIPPAVVLGYSQGGPVAQQLALDYPELVSRLVLACTYACNIATFQEKLEGMLGPWLIRLLSTTRFARMTTEAMGYLTPNQATMLETMIASNEKPRMIETYKAMLDFDSRLRLHEIQCPTLVLAGEKDNAVPMHHAKMLAQGISGARLQVVPGAGHAMVFTHPQEFVDAVQVFLGEGLQKDVLIS
jgi:3-oxoadipate enol-lactonase